MKIMRRKVNFKMILLMSQRSSIEVEIDRSSVFNDYDIIIFMSKL
jgi:hypothetical protein